MDYSDILSDAFKLREIILQSDLYLDMKEKEMKMLEDEEVSNLLYLFENLKEEYGQAKRFEKYGADVSLVQKKLSEVKYKLYENSLVKAYNLAYKKMKVQLKYIEDIILEDIK